MSAVVTNELHVERLTQADAQAVAAIASEMEGFTIPSDYVVWMLLETNPNYCLSAKKDGALLGYLLALKTLENDRLFVWQLGVATEARSRSHQVLKSLGEALAQACKTGGVHHLEFTTNKRRIHLLSRLSRSVFGSTHEIKGTVTFTDQKGSPQEETIVALTIQ